MRLLAAAVVTVLAVAGCAAQDAPEPEPEPAEAEETDLTSDPQITRACNRWDTLGSDISEHGQQVEGFIPRLTRIRELAEEAESGALLDQVDYLLVAAEDGDSERIREGLERIEVVCLAY